MQLFHPDASFRRAVTHVPHGVGIALFGLHIDWTAAAIGAFLFVVYERNEDRHTGDQAWKDELGALIGFFSTLTIALIITFLT